MSLPGNDVMGAGAPQGNPSTSARIQYVVQNQGAPNEHLMMIQEFKKPGKYRFYTSQSNRSAEARDKDIKSLNRGLSLAAELVRDPVLICTSPQLPSNSVVTKMD